MNDSLHIQHLRLHSEGGNASAERLAVERLLGSADLRPPGMHASAVLVVRRLVDPQPGRMAIGLAAVSVDTGWEQAVRQRLAELYRGAARPGHGAVPPGAEAVLFSDAGEQLACLMLDVRRRLVQQRWWWRAVLGSAWGAHGSLSQAETAEALARYMSRQAHLVPAALGWLKERGQAAEAILAIAPAQAEQVLHAVVRAYRLPNLPGVAEAPAQSAPAPWKVDQAAGGLGPERIALLSLALDLHDRPHEVRAPGYQRRLHAWWQAARSSTRAGPPRSEGQHQEANAGSPEVPGSSNQTVQPADSGTAPAGQARFYSTGDESVQFEKVAVSDRHAAQAQGSQNPRIRAQAAPAAAMRHAGETAKPGAALAESPLDFSAPTRQAGRAQLAGDGAAPVADATPASAVGDQPDELIATSLAGGVSTQLGGVLYLINLMVFLGLPGCFEDGWRLASQVGPWGLLEALGRELAGGDIAGLEDDPLWVALALLDARAPGEPPGFRLPRARPRRWPEFRLPDAWLAGLPRGEEHAQEYSLGRSKKVANTRYAPPLRRWLALALPFVSYRLHLALSLPRQASLTQHLLKLPARLYITSSHIDLAASVEAVSLPVRMAGLDRDPGWLPDFGRVVYFHFE